MIWEAVDDPRGIYIVEGWNDEHPTIIAHLSKLLDREKAVQCARIMRTAPQLLQVMTYYLDMVDSNYPGARDLVPDAIQKMRDVVKSATENRKATDE